MTQARNAADLVNSAVLGGNLTIGNTTISATSVASDAFAPNAVFGGFMRNRIINGDMKIWQRGTSFTVTATGSPTYTADRWGVSPTGASVSVGQGGGPTGFPQTSLVVYGNTGLTSVQIGQRIESVNCVDLISKSVTVSGYIWQSTGSPLSGVTVRLARANAVDNYTSVTQMGSTYTISTFPSSQWTRFTCTFTTDGSASNGFVLLIDTNTGYSSSAVIALNGMQLEVGTVATIYEFQPYSDQLVRCQRYYEISSGYWSFNGSSWSLTTPFKVTKRSTPTITVATLGGQTVSISSGAYVGTDSFRAVSSGASDFSWTASAEL